MKKSQNLFLPVLLAALFISVSIIPAKVLAQGAIGTEDMNSTQVQGNQTTKTGEALPTLTNPLKANSVEEVLFLIVDIAVYVGIIFAVIMIIYSGFKFIAAQGNPKELEEARKFFFAIIIGLAILLAAKGIVEIVKNTLIGAKVVDPKAFNKPN